MTDLMPGHVLGWAMSRAGFEALREWAREWALDPRYTHLLDGTSHDLDAGIARNVLILAANGIETYESCQGGEGHCYPEPAIRFHGNQAEGFHALAIAHTFGLGATSIERHWQIYDGEPNGPEWQITFRTASTA